MNSIDTGIRALAQALCGEQTQEEETLLYAVCDAVRAELAARLRSGVRPEDCAESFVPAAALAACSLCRSIRQQGLSSFQAGAVNLSFDRGQPHYALARQLLAPWMQGSVAFVGV